MPQEHPTRDLASVLERLALRERWLLLAALFLATGLLLLTFDAATGVMQRWAVGTMLDRLSRNMSLHDVALASTIQLAEHDEVRVSRTVPRPAGIDVVVAELDLACGAASLAAADARGKLIESSRDYRLITVDGAGKYLLVLTVLGPSAPPEGYRLLLRSQAGCASSVTLRRLADPDLSEWNEPLLMAGFRRDGAGWRILPGAGPAWVARKPATEWIEGALKHER